MKKERHWKITYGQMCNYLFLAGFTSYPLSYVLWSCSSLIYSGIQWDVRVCNWRMSFAVFWPILRECLEDKGLF